VRRVGQNPGVAGVALPTTDTRAWVPAALAPAALYLVVRAVGVAVLAVMAGRDSTDVTTALSAWDGGWLLGIARLGYAGIPDDALDAFGNHTLFTALGFFPGYPGAVAALGPLTGGDLLVAGLLVSLLSGIAGAYALVRLGELVPGGSHRAGLLLVALFAASPMGVVLSMTYTEALFCALAAWALVGVLRRQWLLAGLCCAAAGLVRPTGTSLVAAVGLAALAAVISRRDGWRPWAGGVLATTGVLGYLGWVAVRTGEPDGWFRIQRTGWGWYLDGGGATARYTANVLSGGGQIFDVAVVLALLATVTLFVVAVHLQVPWPLLVYAALVLVTVWGTDGLTTSKLRLLLPAFVLLLPVAVGLAGRRRSTVIAVVVAVTLASAWFGGYALTIWRYAI
jgi:hypothetical protein